MRVQPNVSHAWPSALLLHVSEDAARQAAAIINQVDPPNQMSSTTVRAGADRRQPRCRGQHPVRQPGAVPSARLAARPGGGSGGLRARAAGGLRQREGAHTRQHHSCRLMRVDICCWRPLASTGQLTAHLPLRRRLLHAGHYSTAAPRGAFNASMCAGAVPGCRGSGSAGAGR